MACRCPHCDRTGISLPDKLFTSAAVWTQQPATCRHCGKPARLSNQAVRLQFLLFIFALALIPWFVPAESRVNAAFIIAGIIVSIGMVTPLQRVLV